jgi:hypothetical protein
VVMGLKDPARKIGSPGLPIEIRELIGRMSRENRSGCATHPQRIAQAGH